MCNGWNACNGLDSIEASTGGANVFCLGRLSCNSIRLINVKHDNNDIVYCGAISSCNGASVANASSIYCTGGTWVEQLHVQI